MGDSFEALSVEFITGYDAHRLECTLHSDARRILAAVQTAGLTQSILSAYRHETLVEVVTHLGLAPHFARLAGLDNIYAHSKAALGRGAGVSNSALPPAEIPFDRRYAAHSTSKVAREEIGVDCVHRQRPATTWLPRKLRKPPRSACWTSRWAELPTGRACASGG